MAEDIAMIQTMDVAPGINNVGRAYDNTQNTKRRKTKRIDTRSEDTIMFPIDRDVLVSNARNLRRNSSLFAWAVRKHLDYVASFNFQCRSGNQEFDRRVEDLMKWWSRPLNCDITGRFSLPELIRLIEGLATVEGDCLVYKLASGHIQIIEGDRIRTPTDLGDHAADLNIKDFVHGVRLNRDQSVMAYAICDRTGSINGFILKELVSSQYVLQRAYRDRYDQYRGVSPLSAALNTYTDIHEAQEYTLMKMKISQLCALTYKHGTAAEDDGESYGFDFGAGPQLMELNPDEEATFIESKTPSTEFQNFMVFAMQAGMKALDIPFSFSDESFTNYSGSRQALIQYQKSAEAKRESLKNILNALTVWRLQLFIADGHLEIPPDITTIDDIEFEWIATGIPWIDPLKEVSADVMAIENKLTSRQAVCKDAGSDWFTIIDQLAAEESYMASKGITLGQATTAMSAIVAAQVTADAAQQDQSPKNQKNSGGKNGNNSNQ